MDYYPYLYIMEYKLHIPKNNYYRDLLKVMNIVSSLNLSELEINMLATMIKNNYTVVNADSRELIRKVLNKDKFVTNNYIKRLKDKGILVSNTENKSLAINPNIIGCVKDNDISFRFKAV